MYSAVIEFGYMLCIFSGNDAYEIMDSFQTMQDLNCLAMMASKRERSKKGKAEAKKLSEFACLCMSGEVDVDDIRNLDIDLSIGSIKCHELLEGDDALDILKEKYPNARVC